VNRLGGQPSTGGGPVPTIRRRRVLLSGDFDDGGQVGAVDRFAFEEQVDDPVESVEISRISLVAVTSASRSSRATSWSMERCVSSA